MRTSPARARIVAPSAWHARPSGDASSANRATIRSASPTSASYSSAVGGPIEQPTGAQKCSCVGQSIDACAAAPAGRPDGGPITAAVRSTACTADRCHGAVRVGITGEPGARG
jgi:hypothetical protein